MFSATYITPKTETCSEMFQNSLAQRGFVSSDAPLARLIGSGVVKKAIAKGIQDGFFGYYSGSTPVVGADGKYQVPLARVRFNTSVGEDEIDSTG